MKELVKRYLDHDLSRAGLLKGLGALGLSVSAAGAIAEALTPLGAQAAEAAGAGASRTVSGTGGALFVQQLKAAGVKYYFFNPSTGDGPIFDAFATEPSIQIIKGIQEGAVVGMADGYARLSGKTAICSVADVGLPNGMTQLVNTFKDRIPLLLVMAAPGQEALGRDGAQDYEHQEVMMQPITKWYWQAESSAGIPEVIRRALKFASTAPGGPVFVSIPSSELGGHATADVMDQSLFDIPMTIRPDRSDTEKIAQMLLSAKNPLLSVGDEVTACHAQAEVVELAELLGLPVSGTSESAGSWSKPFPTMHPLYIGPTLREMRFPGQVDVRLNIGNAFAEMRSPGSTLISIRSDPTSLARVSPVDMPVVADTKLATADLLAALKSMATADRLRQIAQERAERVHAYTAAQKQLREQILKDVSRTDSGPIVIERLGIELEQQLDPDTIYVAELETGRKMNAFMSFGYNAKQYIANGPAILGWSMAAALGAKLAQPDKPVVAVLGDGAFLFGGPQPLWSQARYNAPITNIVLNNLSYNNERNRIWSFVAGDQLRLGLDMTCYNGSPDVDFAKTAQAFGVEAETVREIGQLKSALQRAKRANVEGRPYLLDVHVAREGIGAASTWYPGFSIAGLRTRHV